jgi:tripartite-type tricarboxylate transporter receptor subunit TctC
MRFHPLARTLCLLASAFIAAPAGADDFYAGKQVQLLIGGTAGGGVDVAARVVARHLGKHLPGNPTIVPRLMPGAGGIRAVEHVASVAPRDGTAIGTASPMTMIEPLIGKRQAGFRATDLVPLGAMA